MGGLIGYLLDFPLGWLVGAMVATIPCAMAGIRVPISWPLRSVMIGVIGLVAGGAFVPETVNQAGNWIFSLAGVAVYCAITTALGLFVCLKLGKLDRTTAAFSAAPGGLSEILVLGPSYGADVRWLSLVHGMRVAVIVVAVPLFIVWAANGSLGASPPNRTIDFTFDLSPLDMAILAACLAIGVVGGRRIGLPAAPLTGPLLLSAIVHYFGLTQANPPQLALIFAQIVIGTSVAQFFANVSLRQIAAGLAIGGGITLINLIIAVLFALGFQTWLQVPFSSGLIALVPGGLPEMSLIAIALELDPAFVSLHHLFRVVLVLVLLPILIPLWADAKPTKGPTTN
ncbi:AbrB family transcriptional regulator [Devosia sp. 2618]|uniref:AbrB family transcriptional regulator n=1 Tax=Devosia sp. 2618 TaxID=3156454 RepID=UPI003397AE56